MSILSRLLLLFFPLLAVTPGLAQETGAPPAEIKIVTRKNPGDLPYRFFLRAQRQLQSYLPPEPRKLDFNFRISFTELPMAERDGYQPLSWGVSVVGDTVDETLALRRGGYFILPELARADEEDATIMFREQSRKKSLDVAWILRTDASGRLPFADIGQALRELRAVQKRISLFSISMRTEKHASYDTLKACFLQAGGELRIGGTGAADATIGQCSLLRLDPARIGSSGAVELAGPVDIVTIVDARDYPGVLTPPAG